MNDFDSSTVIRMADPFGVWGHVRSRRVRMMVQVGALALVLAAASGVAASGANLSEMVAWIVVAVISLVALKLGLVSATLSMRGSRLGATSPGPGHAAGVLSDPDPADDERADFVDRLQRLERASGAPVDDLSRLEVRYVLQQDQIHALLDRLDSVEQRVTPELGARRGMLGDGQSRSV